MFQSAPLTKARGDADPAIQLLADIEVSIRSPHKSKGRLGSARHYQWLRGFNPLPSQKQGETWLCAASGLGRHVSIRSPHKSKGRRPGGGRGLRGVSVSIRSPHKSKGRPRGSGRAAPATGVSIRSPHKSKGRRPAAPTRTPVTGVSIRSPHKSKGRLAIVVVIEVVAVFQSAPLTKARGDPRNTGTPLCPSGFNPLPSQKQGETDTGAP